MDEIEFRRRVYANPQSPEQELLDADSDNPDYQKILDQAQELDTDVSNAVTAISVPADLQDKLLKIPASAGISGEELIQRESANSSYFHYYAAAATFLLAIGVTFSIVFNSGPSVQDIALGDNVLDHLYIDFEEINAFSRGEGNNFEIVNAANVSQILANAGTQFLSNDFMRSMPVRVAKPCEIIPAFQSAHLILQGSRGAVSVFVINNSPVSVEYRFRDDRFNGVVIPMGKGNMILVGEETENLDPYKDLFADNVEWVI